jgi:hypothetical protein
MNDFAGALGPLLTLFYDDGKLRKGPTGHAADAEDRRRRAGAKALQLAVRFGVGYLGNITTAARSQPNACELAMGLFRSPL